MEDIYVKLWDVEQALCSACQRSVIGICPHRGQTLDSDKTLCPTLKALRQLPQINIKDTQKDG